MRTHAALAKAASMAACVLLLAAVATLGSGCAGDRAGTAEPEGMAGPEESEAPDTTEAAGAPLAYLNHVFAVVDAETYAAIGESRFLQNMFGAYEERTTHAADGDTWTGRYFYGESTYFEFFEPGSIQFPEGYAGTAYGVDDAAQLEEIAARWQEGLGLIPVTALQERIRPDGVAVPWFDMLFVTPADRVSAMMTWTMAWRPTYMRDWYGDDAEPTAILTHTEYLSRMYMPERLLRDVRSVTIAVPEAAAAAWMRELELLGFATSGDGEARSARGPEVEFHTVPTGDGPSGLRELGFEIASADEFSVNVGPLSRIESPGDGTAIWRFSGPDDG